MSAVKRKVEDALNVKDQVDAGANAEPKLKSENPGAAAADQQKSTGSAAETGITREQLQYYYREIFPFKDMFSWLSYGNDPHAASEVVDREFFKKREFSMTTESNGEETYIRYRAYLDHKEWKKEVTEKCPVKLDIGAVFNAPPSMRHTLKNLHPTQKELVFDIDMTDYDDIRKCCDGAKICSKCWILMTAAVKVIDRALREDFGFENIMFVYSGRRGIHCWVCDERARVLSNDARTAIVEYLTFFQGGSQNAKKVNMGSIHPSAERAFQILDPYFSKYIEEQDLLAFPEMQQIILDLIPQEKDEKGGLRDAIKEEWATSQYGSGYKYKQLRKTLRAGPGEKPTKKEKEAYMIVLMEIVFSFIYPRLDVNVSKHLNHLLKSPFCVHPKTGRVCVPIEVSHVDEFSPFQVPTLSSLIAEMDAAAKRENGEAVETTLTPYTNYFHKNFVNPILLAERRKLATKASSSMEF